MARKSTVELAEKTQEADILQEESQNTAKQESNVSPEVEKLMKLYPYLEKLWITPEGFVHPEGVPEIFREGATLYENKYYKQ